MEDKEIKVVEATIGTSPDSTPTLRQKCIVVGHMGARVETTIPAGIVKIEVQAPKKMLPH
eukprot:5438531-Ditylum_brightwellii.AAC.1